MKKFLSIFVALAMVLSLFAGVGARSAKAATATYTLGATTPDTAAWDFTNPHVGLSSVKLAKVRSTLASSTYVSFPLDGTVTLANLATFAGSFWYYASQATSGPQLELDFTAPTGTGHVEVTVMPLQYTAVLNTWTLCSVGSTSTPALFYGNSTGGAAFGVGTVSTLGETVAAIATAAAEATGTWKLTGARVELWEAGTRSVKIDDITIAGTTYAVEPAVPTHTTGTLSSIAITPLAFSMAVGETKQFQATGTYTDGAGTIGDLTSSVTWRLLTGVGTFGTTTATAGLFTAGSTVGPATFTATMSGLSAPTATVTVTADVHALQYITITPNPVTVTGTQQFVATGNYLTAPLTDDITDWVVWTASSVGVGTFSTVTDGLFTAGSTVGGGYVTATLNGIKGYATVTSNLVIATSLTIKTLGGLTSPAYIEEGKTIKLVAVDQTGAIVTPAWTSGSIAVATVGATTGLVLAVTDSGVSVITATLGDVTSTFVVVTIPVQTITSLAVTLVPATLKVAGKQQFGAIAKNAAYSALDYTTQAAWTDDLAVASISNAAGKQGLLTFSTAETGHVYASAGGFTATGTVTIDAAGVLTMTTVVAPVTRVIALTVGTDIVTIDGKATSVDAAPEIVNGRTFVPIRFIAETFGSTVTWLPETRGVTITLGTTTIGLQIGNKTVVINTKIIALEAAPYIKNSRTMVPLRVISESFGGDVAWDGVNKIITITYLLP